MRCILSALCLISFFLCTAQQTPALQVLQSGKRVSLRGLSVVDDNIIWASGSSGSVARSTNGGQSWAWIKVPGYEKRDFRDIEAFDSNTAIIMGIDAPAVILKTKDGGKNWKKVFEDSTKGMFLDAMDFFDEEHGVVIGDPINNTVYLAFTDDNGESWTKQTGGGFAAKDGEAFFASSGTNVKLLDKKHHLVFASGGKSSGVFFNGKRDSLNIIQGKESTGANSIAVYNNKKAVIVGGDFAKDTIRANNSVLLTLGKKNHFTALSTSPHGYRSCVIYIDENNLVTCGTSGIDISKDGGMNWELISKESFHVCQKAKKGNAIFLAGGNGRIARLVMP